jgi:hypothetical protein
MNILRGLGTFILSFLLFLSLTVFGMAFLLHSTLLNPDFVAAQVDKIDVSELSRDITEEQIAGKLPEEAEFLKDAVLDVIDDQEPWLKEQRHNAIYTSYDFLLGKSDKLEITVPLESLKADIKDSLWESLNEQISTWLPDIVKNELRPYLDEHLHDYAQEIPKEYLPPEIVGLPEEQLQQYLDQFLQNLDEQITNENITPEVSGLLEALIKPYFDQYYEEFVEQIPSEIVLDEEEIPADVMEQLLLAKKYISYFQTGYYALIAFMVILVAGIFLINWNVSKAARALGIDLTLYGVLELAGVIFARTFNPMKFIPDIPVSMETWLSGLFKDILAPLQLFSIVIIVIGIALIVASFFFKRKAAEAQE